MRNNVEALEIKNPKSNLVKIHEILEQGIAWANSRAGYRIGPDQVNAVISTLISEYLEKPKTLIDSFYTQPYNLKLGAKEEKRKKQDNPRLADKSKNEKPESMDNDTRFSLLKTINDSIEEDHEKRC